MQAMLVAFWGQLHPKEQGKNKKGELIKIGQCRACWEKHIGVTMKSLDQIVT